jgi:hypothetical protein
MPASGATTSVSTGGCDEAVFDPLGCKGAVAAATAGISWLLSADTSKTAGNMGSLTGPAISDCVSCSGLVCLNFLIPDSMSCPARQNEELYLVRQLLLVPLLGSVTQEQRPDDVCLIYFISAK